MQRKRSRIELRALFGKFMAKVRPNKKFALKKAINLQSVSSSNLHSVGYDPEAEVLEIAFKGKDRKKRSSYRYSDVPQSVYKGLMRAKSKGKYFNKKIRMEYPYTQV